MDDYFIISDINGRFNSLLKREDYTALKNCKSLEEIVVKLNQHFSFINEDMNYDELRTKFVENVLYELSEFNGEKIEYFVKFYKICNFFNKVDGVKEHIIGSFPELKAIDLCNNFDDIQKLCINYCFLSKYFKDIKKYENQKTMLIVMKIFMDEMYKNASGYFKEILENEGNRQILEICLSGKNLENKAQYFPNATNLNGKDIEKLNNTCDITVIKQIFGFSDQEPVENMVKRLSIVYSKSFSQYNDNACVYAYFKLKEQEIENIMWIINCFLQNAPEKMDEIIFYE